MYYSVGYEQSPLLNYRLQRCRPSSTLKYPSSRNRVKLLNSPRLPDRVDPVNAVNLRGSSQLVLALALTPIRYGEAELDHRQCNFMTHSELCCVVTADQNTIVHTLPNLAGGVQEAFRSMGDLLSLSQYDPSSNSTPVGRVLFSDS
ncbi:jg5417 [Pararge aegeria aegeria]|uniref:Jg5417 protein n=1 Tax=Pararge aegeria aegeria TaxID=348720 RepID=A0A8S4SCA6_9NEOP|nr:jg5417 [Pararge aegeria aegeria]